MKKLALFFIVISYALTSLAQEKVTKSKIKLVDGSELEVLIIENVPGEYIKIRLPGNEVATVSYDKITSIKHSSFKYQGKFLLKKGFHIDGSFSLLFGRSTQESEPRIGIAMGISGNYRFNSFLSLGVGVEPTALFLNGENLMLPLYARLKGSIREARVSTIYMLDVGAAFAGNNQDIDTTVKGGWFARPSIGLRISKFAILVGYQVQELTTTRTNSWNVNDFTSVEKRIMKNIVFSTRLTF